MSYLRKGNQKKTVMKKIIFTWGPEFTLKMSLGNRDSRSKQVEQF